MKLRPNELLFASDGFYEDSSKNSIQLLRIKLDRTFQYEEITQDNGIESKKGVSGTLPAAELEKITQALTSIRNLKTKHKIIVEGLTGRLLSFRDGESVVTIDLNCALEYINGTLKLPAFDHAWQVIHSVIYTYTKFEPAGR